MLSASLSHASTLTLLKSTVEPVLDGRTLPFGVGEIDRRLAMRGLRAGGVHEATASTATMADDAAAILFLAGIAAREARAQDGLVLWVSCRSDLYAPGLEQAGLPAAHVVFAQPRDDAALLAVVEDAVRDGTPCAVVAEAGRVSMVATRRLQLVAAEADLPILLLRRRLRADRDPLAEPSTAITRWRIGAASSASLVVAGVGRPRWSIDLVRQRGGAPFSLMVEGCDETGRLAVPAELGHRPAETARTVRHATG